MAAFEPSAAARSSASSTSGDVLDANGTNVAPSQNETSTTNATGQSDAGRAVMPVADIRPLINRGASDTTSRVGSSGARKDALGGMTLPERRAPAAPPSSGEWSDNTLPQVARARPAPAPLEREIRPLPALPGLPQPLPRRRARRRWGTLLGFLLFFVVPAAGVGAYYFHYAKPMYVADFRFSVTEQTPALPASQAPPTNTMTAPPGTTITPTAAASTAMMGAPASGGSVQNFVVIDYVQSREAVEELQRRIKIKTMLANEDPWYRIAENATTERFMNFWKTIVEANYDPVTGLAFVQVKAFSPQNALLISQTLMEMSEKLVNDIAGRSNNDTVSFAEDQVKRAEARVKTAADALAQFRKTDKVIDPSSSAVQANTNLMLAQRLTLQQLETQLRSLENQALSPLSPVASGLRARIGASKSEIARLESEIREQGAGTGALVGVVGRYEKLDLERQYANASYMNALMASDQARANAAAQHIYLTPYSRPHLPQQSTFPNAPRSFALALVGLFFLWVMGLLIVRTVRDHQL